MRVLILSQTSEVGGGPEHCYLLLKELRAFGTVELFVASPNNGPYFERFSVIVGADHIIEIDPKSLNPLNIIRLIQYLSTHNIEILHSHGKYAGLYARVIGLFSKIKVVHTFHGLHYKVHAGFKRKLHLLLERFLSGGIDCFVNVSHGEHEEALGLGIVTDQNSTTIVNGVDLKKFEVDPADLLELGIQQHEKVLALVARLTGAKGHDTLILALPKILKKCPDTKVLFAGTGSAEQSLRSLVEVHGVADAVIFAGNRSDIPAILKRSSIFVLPSLHEGLPMTILEAMAAKVPIVATDITGIREVVPTPDVGVLVPVNDVDALANAIIDLLQDRGMATIMAQNAYTRLLEHYTSKQMAEKTYEVYKSVAN